MPPELSSLIESLKDVHNPISFVFLAAVVGGLVRILKTKTVGDLLDAIPLAFVRRIPKDKLPWLAVVLGAVLALLDAKLNAGLSWTQSLMTAVFGAILGGGTAIGGHETAGKAIANARAKDATTRGPTGPVAVLLLGLLAWSAGVAHDVEAYGEPPAAALVGCSPALRQAIADVAMSAAQIECVKRSAEIDDAKVAAGCGLLNTPEFRDLIRNLIAEREAARRSGFMWPAHDAGGADAAR